MDIYIATEEATGSASAEVVGSGSTGLGISWGSWRTQYKSKLELQAVQIITENPWHLFQSASWLWEQQGWADHQCIWWGRFDSSWIPFAINISARRSSFSGNYSPHLGKVSTFRSCYFVLHSCMEIGRMTGYVKKYHSTAEAEPINRSFNTMNLLAGDVMYQNLLQQDQKTGIQLHWHENELRRRIQQRWIWSKDVWFVCWSSEDLYTNIIDAYVRKTPALWEEFVMKKEDGKWYLVGPNPSVGEPTEATARIFASTSTTTSNFHHGCVVGNWKKTEGDRWEATSRIFCRVCFESTSKYIEEGQLLMMTITSIWWSNTQSRTFEDANYVELHWIKGCHQTTFWNSRVFC